MNAPARISDLVCGILETIYNTHRARLEGQAKMRGISLKQLAAATITQAILEAERPPYAAAPVL